MERNAGLAAAAVWLLCCVLLVSGAASAYSVPADPRQPTWQPALSPAAARRGHYHHHHHHGPAGSPSPRQGLRGVSPAPAWPHYSAPAPAPPHFLSAPAPAPTAGADHLPSLPPPAYARAPSTPPQQATTTPHFGFPLEPTVGVAAARPAGAPGTAGGEGYPFIGSNPTVPLPTGVTDTATVLPLPDAAGGKVVGRAAAGPGRARPAMIGLLLVSSTVLLSSSCRSWS